MKKQMLLTLAFGLLLTLLAGCGGQPDTGSAPATAVPSPTSADQPTAPPVAETVTPVATAGSDGSASLPPTSGGSSSPTANPGSDVGTVKLSVVKYVLIPPEEGGLTSYYMGIVKNEGTATVTQLQLHMLDDSGNEASGSDDLLTEVFALRPGESAGFRVDYDGPEIKQPQFRVDGQPVGEAAFLVAQLSVLNQQASTSPDGFPIVEGEVRNDGDKQVDLWKVNIIAYDASGTIVDVGGGSPAGSSTFPAHSTARFHSMLSMRSAKATRFDVIATGQNH